MVKIIIESEKVWFLEATTARAACECRLEIHWDLRSLVPLVNERVGNEAKKTRSYAGMRLVDIVDTGTYIAGNVL